MPIRELKLDIYWRSALSSGQQGQGYKYPEKFTKFFRGCYSGPAVYRWRTHPGQDGRPDAVYVGEADNLAQRIQRVCTPPRNGKGGATNRRLKREFDEATENGKNVYLDVADFDPFELNGILISPDGLDDKFKRCFIENLCLCTLEKHGHEVLNKRLEPIREVERKFQKLSPREKRWVLEQAQGLKKEAKCK